MGNDDDPAVVQDRLNRVVTALFIERSGEENSVRWGGPRISDLVADDERWMMDLLRDTVNESAEVHETMALHGKAFAVVSEDDQGDVVLRFLPAGSS